MRIISCKYLSSVSSPMTSATSPAMDRHRAPRSHPWCKVLYFHSFLNESSQVHEILRIPVYKRIDGYNGVQT